MKALSNAPAFLFDLDGRLVDSVYQHVLAWREALEPSGIELAVWRIHRRIGMSDGALVHALLIETGHSVIPDPAEQLPRFPAEAFAHYLAQVQPLPGATDLLAALSKNGLPWAIATGGSLASSRGILSVLGIGPKTTLITRDQVRRAKADPDLFLAAGERLPVDNRTPMVVGDSIWDLLAAQRASALGIGPLSDGFGQDELEQAGAYRVYQDPLDLLRHFDEVGVRNAA
jgi:HAD superfamily hydrolase (TIGR01549 family)